jgi:hypothetical protein
MPLSRTGGAPAPVHPHSHGQFYRGTHSHSRLSHFLYNGSLGVLVVILSCVLLATGYDIFQQVIVVSRGQIRFSDTIVTGGAYVLTFLIASGIIFSRRYTTKRELQAIPKGYIPTGKDELSKVRWTGQSVYRETLALLLTGPASPRTCTASSRPSSRAAQ